MMPESNALARILAYMAESRINSALEAGNIAKMTPRAIMVENIGELSITIASEIQRLDSIY